LNDPPPSGHHAPVTALPMTLPLPPAGTVPERRSQDEHEDALVDRLRAGDRDAVEETYLAHHATIRSFARRLVGDRATAEDMVHETFLALPRAIRRFRGKGTLRSFLIGVAINHARRHVRSAARRRRAVERMASRDELAPRAIDASEELARKQLADRLWAALDQLSIDQRIAFVLCEAEQRTSVEVAAIVGVPEGTVRTRLYHAKRKLRAALEDER
jgi:RNA polymerase sigma-70 factor (ECF subfamily)